MRILSEYSNNKIVSYGSRALSPTDQRYSQTERGALACVWGCEHFHLYIFGKEFTLITDHAPLESIMNGVKTIQSVRLERFRLRLTTYNFKVKYRIVQEPKSVATLENTFALPK